jgi:hypothetical protein
MTDLTNPLHRPVDRRRFLQGAALALGAGAVGGPFGALARAAADPRTAPGRARRDAGAGYGPLFPATDQTTGQQLISLPRGFEYLTFGRTGEVMADGIATPGSHDGMAAFRVGDQVHLVRNHERGAGATFGPGSLTYDPLAAGGTTTLVFDPDEGRLVESYASLAGTMTNCAGGPTPWGSWLSCEENFTVSSGGRRHGYVFEVPASGTGRPVPLTALGRFKREAIAIDPSTGIVYMTEDEGQSALYRFVPTTPGDLTSGTVEAMKLASGNDTRPWATGTSSPVEWVPIAVPDPDPSTGQPTVRAQAFAAGAAIIARGEGAWFGNGVVYVISTSGGAKGLGQVFALEPGRDVFTSVYTSEDAEVLAAPDNVCVSPRGGLVLCEDGSGVEYLHGLTPAGDIFRFASNDLNSSEWAGATFEPKSGNWLFVNLQTPGITFAITGPWRQGAL